MNEYHYRVMIYMPFDEPFIIILMIMIMLTLKVTTFFALVHYNNSVVLSNPIQLRGVIKYS